ncbi:phenylacetic acid degradation PaaB family protein [Natronoarchaeum sp. GCM10025703]
MTAQNERLAKMYAHNTFNEEDWDYLAVVRRDNLIEVTGEKPIPGVGSHE